MSGRQQKAEHGRHNGRTAISNAAEGQIENWGALMSFGITRRIQQWSERLQGLQPAVLGLVLYSGSLALTLYAIFRFPEKVLTGDQLSYDSIARNLVIGNGFLNTPPPTVDAVPVLPPLYPLFLAGVYALAGPSPMAAKVAQALIVSAVPLLLFVIGQRMVTRQASLLVGVLWLLYVPFYYWSKLLLTDGPYVAVVLATLAVLQEVNHYPLLRNAFGAGLMLSLGLLVRGTLIFLLPLSAFWLVWRWGLRRGSMLAVALIAGAILLITPWVVRNFVVYHRLIPIASYGGQNLYIGNNPYTDSRYYDGSQLGGERNAFYTRARELPFIERDPLLQHEAISYMRAHPFKTVAVSALRAVRFWAPVWMPRPPFNQLAFLGRWTESGLYGIEFIILPLGAVGAWVSRRRWRDLMPSYLILASVTLIHAFTLVLADGRYRLAVMPFVFLFGAEAVVNGAHRLFRFRVQDS